MASSQVLLALVATTTLLFLTTVESANFRIYPVNLCGNAAFPDACTSVMKDVLGNKRAALRANIQATKLQTSQAMTEVKNLAPKASETSKACLDAANQQYEGVVSNLDDALKAMDAKDRDTLNAMLAAAETAFTDIDTCYDDIGESNPVGKPNAFLKKLAANSLYLYDKIKV